jgi:hypothetical protein
MAPKKKGCVSAEARARYSGVLKTLEATRLAGIGKVSFLTTQNEQEAFLPNRLGTACGRRFCYTFTVRIN